MLSTQGPGGKVEGAHSRPKARLEGGDSSLQRRVFKDERVRVQESACEGESAMVIQGGGHINTVTSKNIKNLKCHNFLTISPIWLKL